MNLAKLDPNVCTDGDIIKKVGTSWVCSAAPSSTPPLSLTDNRMIYVDANTIKLKALHGGKMVVKINDTLYESIADQIYVRATGNPCPVGETCSTTSGITLNPSGWNYVYAVPDISTPTKFNLEVSNNSPKDTQSGLLASSPWKYMGAFYSQTTIFRFVQESSSRFALFHSWSVGVNDGLLLGGGGEQTKSLTSVPKTAVSAGFSVRIEDNYVGQSIQNVNLGIFASTECSLSGNSTTMRVDHLKSCSLLFDPDAPSAPELSYDGWYAGDAYIYRLLYR